jgi:tetratricopeptide (TPR) repeat protein
LRHAEFAPKARAASVAQLQQRRKKCDFPLISVAHQRTRTLAIPAKERHFEGVASESLKHVSPRPGQIRQQWIFAKERAVITLKSLLASVACAFLVTAASGAGAEESAREEQARLADVIRQHPQEYDATYRYVLLSVELRDEEAAIGALERLLDFNPNLSRARKELGFLYAQLGAYPTAALHLKKALAAPGLDPAHKAQIEAQLPDIEKRTQASRFSGRFQTGLRVQSNANYFPTDSLFNAQGGFLPNLAFGQSSDVNAFEYGRLSHEYDFQNGRGDLWESDGFGYLAQQFSLSQYNVALFSGSTGPRLALSPELLPGVTVRPYATGAVSMLGDINYLNTGGFGVSARVPIGRLARIEPGVEWRAQHVDGRDRFGAPGFGTLQSLATGDSITGYYATSYDATDYIRIETKTFYTRFSARNAFQSSDFYGTEAVLRLETEPPFREIPRRWTIAPFVRYAQQNFDAANPIVDPFRTRRDTIWTYGVGLDAPINGWLSVAGQLQYIDDISNIKSFRTHSLSLAIGPVARF